MVRPYCGLLLLFSTKQISLLEFDQKRSKALENDTRLQPNITGNSYLLVFCGCRFVAKKMSPAMTSLWTFGNCSDVRRVMAFEGQTRSEIEKKEKEMKAGEAFKGPATTKLVDDPSPSH